MKESTSVTLHLFIFGGVSDTGEDGHSDSQIQQQDADLTVTVLHKQDGGKLVRNFNVCRSGTVGGQLVLSSFNLFTAANLNVPLSHPRNLLACL